MPEWYKIKNFENMTREPMVTANSAEVKIRLFNNKFFWSWQKFTEDRRVVAQILQKTKEYLGYDAGSKSKQVYFQNIKERRVKDGQSYVQGTGEWFLDTRMFQRDHAMNSDEANDKIKDAFLKALGEVGEEEGINFSITVTDMLRLNTVTQTV